MRAVTIQGPGEIAVVDKPEPELEDPRDAIVKVGRSGVCGSDLHIYHGRVAVEPGFTIGHEFVGEVVQTGSAVSGVQTGDTVLGTFHTACGNCFFCRSANFQKCDHARVYGHGSVLGSLQGTQADEALVPMADLTLRKVPEGLSEDSALFAGDVMGTGYHGVVAAGLQPGDVCVVIGCGPVGLCSVMAARVAGASRVFALDTVADRLEVARSLGAEPVHATEEDPKKAVRGATEGRGADVVVECVGSEPTLDTAIRLARKCGTVSITGVFAEKAQVHMGLAWLKSLNVVAGHANVIGHLDRVLALMAAGRLDPTPLVTHHMSLDEAAEAYRIYDAREALKIVLET